MNTALRSRRKIRCPDCRGKGRVFSMWNPKLQPGHACWTCNGTGRVYPSSAELNGL